MLRILSRRVFIFFQCLVIWVGVDKRMKGKRTKPQANTNTEVAYKKRGKDATKGQIPNAA